MSILLTLVLSLVLLDPVLGDDRAPRLSVYPPVPGLEPSPYYGLRVREVSWSTCLGTDFVDVVTSRLAKKVGKIFSLSWPSAQQRNSATPLGCLTTSSIWTILVLFICLLNKEPQMENSGTGATLMWTSKLSMAPELNSRCLNKMSSIDVDMKKITRFEIFWPGDPTLEWYHDKKCSRPPRYIYVTCNSLRSKDCKTIVNQSKQMS